MPPKPVRPPFRDHPIDTFVVKHLPVKLPARCPHLFLDPPDLPPAIPNPKPPRILDHLLQKLPSLIRRGGVLALLLPEEDWLRFADEVVGAPTGW